MRITQISLIVIINHPISINIHKLQITEPGLQGLHAQRRRTMRRLFVSAQGNHISPMRLRAKGTTHAGACCFDNRSRM